MKKEHFKHINKQRIEREINEYVLCAMVVITVASIILLNFAFGVERVDIANITYAEVCYVPGAGHMRMTEPNKSGVLKRLNEKDLEKLVLILNDHELYPDDTQAKDSGYNNKAYIAVYTADSQVINFFFSQDGAHVLRQGTNEMYLKLNSAEYAKLSEILISYGLSWS